MQTLDKYQILEKIGVGGFGVVYKATDPFIKRFVAIKTCTSADPETRERFLREAEIAGNLHHRNIVTVYDFGYQDETPYLVQEYLTGEDLDHKIRRHEFLPMPTKVLYLVQVARGLDYAHTHGVVHRDIKPANIRILDDDTAKIMDFGIARLLQQQQGLTQAGITLGTAAYLAPEQIKGESCDARTDIFSFGALAYELVSGERPFGGADISAVFYRILNEEVPPLRKAVPECPFDLEKIVMRCLEKEPVKRFPSSRELLKALEDLAKRRGSIDTATSIPLRRPTPATPAGAAPADPEPITAATSAAPPPAAHPRSFDDFVLDTPHPGDGSKSDGLDTVAFRRHRGGGLFKIAAVLALVAAGGWIALRMRDGGSASPGSQAATSAPPAAAATQPAPAPANTGTEVGSPASPAAGAPETPATPETTATPAVTTPDPAAAPGSADPAAAPAGNVAPEPAPVVEPPPKPEPAVLVVEPGWDSAMTVRLGKKSWPLDRERRFELEAGSYKLKFAIASPVYSHEEEVTVRLEEGATKRVAVPLERPGRLTVQPHLNTPQGYVRVDGTAAGSTPLRGRWLAPGPHVVEIAASPDPAGAALFSESIEIASDRETLLSFDLSGKLERRVSTRAALPN